MAPSVNDGRFISQIKLAENGGNSTNRMPGVVVTCTSKTTNDGSSPISGEPKRKFKCELCGRVFLKRWHLIYHIRMHTGEKPHQCDRCDRAFRQKGDLNRHLTVHTGVKPYKCHDCGKAFNHKSNLVQHTRRHTGERPYQCRECKKSFSRKSVLIQHIFSHTGDKPFRCDHCQKIFSSKGALRKHAWQHNGGWPYTCGKCNKGFSDRTHLTTHMRIHSGEKPYECESCGKNFSDKSNLGRHVKIHSCNPNNTCKQRRKFFNGRKSKDSEDPQTLTIHHKCRDHFFETMTTQKHDFTRYVCDVCKKEFALKSNLAKHFVLHTGEKPYKCNECGRDFAHMSNMTRHRKTHLGEKIFKCRHCCKEFTRSSSLKNHLETHVQPHYINELKNLEPRGTVQPGNRRHTSSDHSTSSDTSCDHSTSSDTNCDHSTSSDTSCDHSTSSDTNCDHSTSSDTSCDHSTSCVPSAGSFGLRRGITNRTITQPSFTSTQVQEYLTTQKDVTGIHNQQELQCAGRRMNHPMVTIPRANILQLKSETQDGYHDALRSETQLQGHFNLQQNMDQLLFTTSRTNIMQVKSEREDNYNNVRSTQRGVTALTPQLTPTVTHHATSPFHPWTIDNMRKQYHNPLVNNTLENHCHNRFQSTNEFYIDKIQRETEKVYKNTRVKAENDCVYRLDLSTTRLAGSLESLHHNNWIDFSTSVKTESESNMKMELELGSEEYYNPNIY